MENVLFVVWRESVEAVLVIGILYAWLKNNPGAERGIPWLWGGVAGGVALAIALGWAMLSVQSGLSDTNLEIFQTAVVFIAAGLITQMVLWMKKHGREMKRHLEQEAEQAARDARWIGIAAVAAIAVAREGAETVIFLYGMGLENSGGMFTLAGSAAAGFLLALATAWAVERGLRFLNYATFFRFSGFLLLLFASALVMNGSERLIGMGWLPPLIDPLWDSASLLDDGTAFGNLVASLTGYRAHPSLTALLLYAAYWAGQSALRRRYNGKR
ncbi:MAG: FTR1 family iron permease [Burkholderiales bacterium]